MRFLALVSVTTVPLLLAMASEAQVSYESTARVLCSRCNPASLTYGGVPMPTPQTELLERVAVFDGSVDGGGTGRGLAEAATDPGRIRLLATGDTSGKGVGFNHQNNFIADAEGIVEIDDLFVTYVGGGSPPTYIDGMLNISVTARIGTSTSYTSELAPPFGPSGGIANTTDFNLQVQALHPASGGDNGMVRVESSAYHISGSNYSETDSGLLDGTAPLLLAGSAFVVQVPVSLRVNQANGVRLTADVSARANGQFTAKFKGVGSNYYNGRYSVQFATNAFTVTGGDPADYQLDSPQGNIVGGVYTPAPADVPAAGRAAWGGLAIGLVALGFYRLRRQIQEHAASIA